RSGRPVGVVEGDVIAQDWALDVLRPTKVCVQNDFGASWTRLLEGDGRGRRRFIGRLEPAAEGVEDRFWTIALGLESASQVRRPIEANLEPPSAARMVDPIHLNLPVEIPTPDSLAVDGRKPLIRGS